MIAAPCLRCRYCGSCSSESAVCREALFSDGVPVDCFRFVEACYHGVEGVSDDGCVAGVFNRNVHGRSGGRGYYFDARYIGAR